MEVINHLLLGLESALTLANLGYCFLGVLIGTFVGSAVIAHLIMKAQGII